MDFMLGNEGKDLSDFSHDRVKESVLISLFSWRKSRPDDGVPVPFRRGWWADSLAEKRIGSRLWLLEREKVTEAVLRRAETYALEALEWLKEDGIVADVSVSAVRASMDRVDLLVTTTKPNVSVIVDNVFGGLDV